MIKYCVMSAMGESWGDPYWEENVMFDAFEPAREAYEDVDVLAIREKASEPRFDGDDNTYPEEAIPYKQLLMVVPMADGDVLVRLAFDDGASIYPAPTTSEEAYNVAIEDLASRLK